MFLRAIALLAVVLPGSVFGAQEPNAVKFETTATVTIDQVDPVRHTVIFHGPQSASQTVYVDPAVAPLTELKAGDVVVITYVESVVVAVRPDAAPSVVKDTTAEARQAGEPGVVQQLKMVVTIESIDPQGVSVTYTTKDGRRIMRPVRDKRLLEGLKPGDRVEVTQTQARALAINPR